MKRKQIIFLVCFGYLNRMFWKPLSESSVVCNYIESSFGLSYLSSKVIRAQLSVVFTRILYDSYIIHFIYICHAIIIIIIRLRTQFTTKKTNKTLLTVDFFINFLRIYISTLSENGLFQRREDCLDKVSFFARIVKV